VLVVAKYENGSRNAAAKMSVPSLALKIGHSICKCCNLTINKALREKDENLERDGQSFVRLFDSEWRYKMSSIALNTQRRQKKQA